MLFPALKRLACPLCCFAFFSLAAVSRAQTGHEERRSAAMRPASIVEDNAVVDQRSRATPWQIAAHHMNPKRDEPAQLPLRSIIIPALDRPREPPRLGQEGEIGWNAGGSCLLRPADPTLAVGPSHIMTATNERLKIFTKEGTQLFDATWPSFFGPVLPPETYNADPKLLFDSQSQRWFVLILALRIPDRYSHFMLAVSDDADPQGVWKKYALDSALNGDVDSYAWSDFPGLGICDDALMITANMLSRQTPVHLYVKLRVIPKAALLAFADEVAWTDLWPLTDIAGDIAFTVQPAASVGPAPIGFLAHGSFGDRLTIYALEDPAGAALLRKTGLPVTPFLPPTNVPQPGGSPRLSAIDNRVFQVGWRAGRLFLSHHHKLDGRTAVRWYELDTSAWPSGMALLQQGDVADSLAHLWFPSIAFNAAGAALTVYCRSGPAEFPSIYVSARSPLDPPGQMRPASPTYQGVRRYDGNGANPLRWGDYSAVVVDPLDDDAFWSFHMAPDPDNGACWITWLQQSRAPQVCQGDADGDADVDLFDVAAHASAFGACLGDPAYAPAVDMDGDLCITVSDTALLLSRFGVACP